MTSSTAAIAAGVDSAACYHCGLPVPAASAPPTLAVLGAERQFCCHGCHAVCETIVDAGLDDYYRYRTSAEIGRARQDSVETLLERLSIYDRPEIQKGFVFRADDYAEASLLLEDIRCPACLWLNERHVRKQPGVIDVHIDPATQRMRIRWDPALIKLSRLLQAIAEIGYSAHPYSTENSDRLEQSRRQRSVQRLLYAGILGMLVMNFSIASYLMGAPDEQGQLPLWMTLGRWSALFVCLTLLIYPGQDFWTGAWNDIRNRRLGMDIPIVLGLSFAFFGSLHNMLAGQGEVYLDSIAMFVFFVLLARHWEMRGRLRAADRLDRLSRAVPGTAHRLSATSEQTIEKCLVVDLEIGDEVMVYPGEQVPIDGEIIEGASRFDESLLTGESRPVLHQTGETVIAGSINGEQPVRVRVAAIGEDTAIGRIGSMVGRGLAAKPDGVLIAERVARWFVLLVLCITAATAAFWYFSGAANWLENTIAVLIVTCPCALALATPVSLVVGAGQFVAAGVVPLRMSALEALAKVSHIVFDKTGTLTSGQLQLDAAIPVLGDDSEPWTGYAASLASRSEHPVAKALAALRTDQSPRFENMVNQPGNGVEGFLDGSRWRLGRVDFAVDKNGLRELEQALPGWRDSARSLAVLARDGAPRALFRFSDSLRSGSLTLRESLTGLGIERLSILSGDTPASVAALGDRLGIADAHSAMSPKDKLNWIRSLQRNNVAVAMVGDGINDAPTLAAADVSVSLAQATDMANASSDFLVLGDSLAVLGPTIRIARAVRRNVHQNLAWAAGYNLLAVPLAMAGLVPPWLAAIGMSASSLVVVSNALRLKGIAGKEESQAQTQTPVVEQLTH